MNRGMGEHQKIIMCETRMELLSLLQDGKWHQYSEIKRNTKLSSATISKHLKMLKDLLDKKVDVESGAYPYPVYYRIKENSRARFMACFGIKVYLHIREFLDALGKAEQQTEYLGLLTEYFHNGIVSLLRYKNEQKDLTAQEVDFMVRLFTRPLEPAIKNFIDWYGQK